MLLTLQVQLQHNPGGVRCVYPKPSAGADQQGTSAEKASFTDTYQVRQQGWQLRQPHDGLVLRVWQASGSSKQAANAAASVLHVFRVVTLSEVDLLLRNTPAAAAKVAYPSIRASSSPKFPERDAAHPWCSLCATGALL